MARTTGIGEAARLDDSLSPSRKAVHTEVQYEQPDAIRRRHRGQPLAGARRDVAPRCPGNAIGATRQALPAWAATLDRRAVAPRIPVWPRRSSTAPAANAFTTATQSVNQAFKSAGDKVASALEVKPKVIPADDPARLSSRPEQLTPELYVQAAQYSENQGSIAQAKQQFERALELDPRNVNTLVAFARFHDRQGNADEAQRRYRQARSLAPTNTIVLNDLGLFHARRGDLAASLDALQQAVRLDPRNVRYRNNLAAALIESQRVTEAVDVLRAVHPEATALFNAACLLSMKNETQQAATLLEQSLRIDPSLVAANQMLRQLRSSDTMLAQPAMPPRGDEAATVNSPLTPTTRNGLP